MFGNIFAGMQAQPTIIRQGDKWLALDPFTGAILCAADSKSDLLDEWIQVKQIKDSAKKKR